MNNTIYDIAKKRYGKSDLEEGISRYGKSKKVEFFAELYANMLLSREPTNLAKALKLYLKGKKQ